MSGINKGVQACVNDKLQREVIFIPCGAHSSNLAVKYACDCSTQFISLFYLLQELYNYFTGSAKRHHILREKLNASEFGLLVKNLAETRWTASFTSLHAVDVSFDQIIENLTYISEQLTDKEAIHQAICLKRKLLFFEIMSLLLFMINVTRVTYALTAHLQGKELDIITVIDVISNSLKLLQHMRNDDNTMINMIERTIRRAVAFDIYVDAEFDRLHRPRQRSRRIDNNPSTAVNLSRNEYYTGLMRQVLDQLYSVYNDYYNTVNNKLRPFHNVTPACVTQFSLNDAERLCSIIPGLSLVTFSLFEPYFNINEKDKCNLTRIMLMNKSSSVRSRVLEHSYDYLDISNYTSISSNLTSLHLRIYGTSSTVTLYLILSIFRVCHGIRHLGLTLQHKYSVENNNINAPISTQSFNDKDYPILSLVISFNLIIYVICDIYSIAYILRCMPNLNRFNFTLASLMTSLPYYRELLNGFVWQQVLKRYV
ncbi:unnamed protein product [Rotaria sp. Silwood1]|nr:unnamed protein product [Rotaria sp. Silwood1]